MVISNHSLKFLFDEKLQKQPSGRVYLKKIISKFVKLFQICKICNITEITLLNSFMTEVSII